MYENKKLQKEIKYLRTEVSKLEKLLSTILVEHDSEVCSLSSQVSTMRAAAVHAQIKCIEYEDVIRIAIKELQ